MGKKSSSTSKKKDIVNSSKCDATEVAHTPLIDRQKYADIGQSKVLDVSEGGIFRLVKMWYYRYTLMTGVYMLDRVERWFLHFFIVLGVIFLAKYSFNFYLAMSERGYL